MSINLYPDPQHFFNVIFYRGTLKRADMIQRIKKNRLGFRNRFDSVL